MNKSLLSRRYLLLCAAALWLVGCSLLNPPKGITSRSFVLTPVQTDAGTSQRQPGGHLIVGIRRVKMPEYLSEKSFAMRQGANEIIYLESTEWAERLDNAFQRVLGANLATLIPTDQVRLSLWGAEAVTLEVEVSVERFDVDSRGQGVLWAWWRVLSPGIEKARASGRFSATRKGPSPKTDPAGAVASLSELAGDLAAKIAQDIRQSRSQ